MKYFKIPELKDINNNKEVKSRSLGLSESWFNNSNLLKLSFDFFYNWKTKQIEKEIFVKKIFKSQIEQDLFLKIFFSNKEKLKNDLLQYFDDYKALEKYGFNVNLLILNDYDEEPIMILLNKKEFRVIQLEEIKQKIREYTGKEFPIGKKGLIYSYTNLERNLSNTTTLYPGDVDLVTFDKNGFILSIFEYQKKIDGNYIFFDQLYANNQKLKYERLIALKNYISEYNLQHNKSASGFNIIHYSHQNSLIVESIYDKNNTTRKEFNINHFLNKQFLSYLSYGFLSIKDNKIDNFFKKSKIAIYNIEDINIDYINDVLKDKINKNECIILIGKNNQAIEDYCLQNNKQIFVFNHNNFIINNLNLIVNETIIIQKDNTIKNKEDKKSTIKLKSF